MALDADDIHHMVKDYRKRLRDVVPKPFLSIALTPSHADVKAHAAYLLDLVTDYVKRGKLKKARRWLGFAQSCLWISGLVTVNEVKGHNEGRGPDDAYEMDGNASCHEDSNGMVHVVLSDGRKTSVPKGVLHEDSDVMKAGTSGKLLVFRQYAEDMKWTQPKISDATSSGSTITGISLLAIGSP